MNKYKAHIISHSHWDREWYLPYEKHHLRLIDLIDDILDEIDKNPDFGSFHLDGQTIMIDDYLEVKPYNQGRLLQAIKLGKIKIGPWYILQDAFLTSSEANIRNLQIGDLDCKRYGAKTNIGYFPDTFGIYSQAPQILKKSNIDNMFFGRGVSPTGFNNQVGGDFESKFSEMRIKAPNSDEVLGILFANWYSNGNEIPKDKEKAKKYWDKKLEEVKRFTNNKNLLFMNGCDHTPMQPDITQAIKVANDLYEDVEFIHSTLEDYLKEIKKEIDKEDLSVIKKELRSQDTDGYYTLVNTLSSRIYQKQKNVEIQDLFEQVVEPISTMIMPKEKYMFDKIVYGWKTLMQNHPHDSICGCSVDEVHDLMDSRFSRAKQIGVAVVDQVLHYYKENVKKEDDKKEFTIFNTTSIEKEQITKVIINYEKEYFGHDFNENRKNLEKIDVSNLVLLDEKNKEVKSIIKDLGTHFDYELPKDKFRRSFYARKLEITFKANIDKFSWKTYTIQKNKESNEEYKVIQDNTNILDNGYLKVEIENSGKINLSNKKLKVEYKNILEIIDQGDIGNEYMFGAVKEDIPIKISKVDHICGYDNGFEKVKEIFAIIKIPKEAKDTLKEEKRKLTEYYKRDTKRSDTLVEMMLKIRLSLGVNSSKLDVDIEFENTCKDHRMRFKINLNEPIKEVESDGIFEVVKRPTKVSSSWKNPNNDQPMQKFVSIIEGNNNIIIKTKGLHEYEVKNKSIYITFLRSVSELGDWGVFPTPKAQCIGEQHVSISIILDDKKNKNKNYNNSRLSDDMPYIQIYKNNGYLQSNNKFLDIKVEDAAFISSLKRNSDLDICLRMYSNGLKSKVEIKEDYKLTNLLEEKEENIKVEEILKNEIITIKINKD